MVLRVEMGKRRQACINHLKHSVRTVNMFEVKILPLRYIVSYKSLKHSDSDL